MTTVKEYLENIYSNGHTLVKECPDKWDDRFIEMAWLVSTWSKDPSTQVGCVIVGGDHRILSLGYNGFPREVHDTKERYEDRATKLSMVVHAELNAIYNACHNGVNLNNSTLYLYSLPPCGDCAKGIIQAGIKNVIFHVPPEKLKMDSSSWASSFDITLTMFKEANIYFGWNV